jgi:hypothetical protein
MIMGRLIEEMFDLVPVHAQRAGLRLLFPKMDVCPYFALPPFLLSPGWNTRLLRRCWHGQSSAAKTAK